MLNTQFLRRVTIDDRDRQVPCASDQRDDFTYWPLAKSVNQAMDLDSVQPHENIFLSFHGITEMFDADIGRDITEMIDVCHLAPPAISSFFWFGQLKTDRVLEWFSQIMKRYTICQMRRDR